MTTLRHHAANQPHPEGLDSVDFYVRNGHRLHARALREGLRSMIDLFRDLGRRRRRSRATAWRL